MRYLLSAALLFISISAFPQNIRSRVLGDDGAPAAFANIAVLNPDSSLVAGTSANADGFFTIAVPNRKFTLAVSCVGYAKFSAECDGRLPENIVLKKQDIDLKEVDVTAHTQGQYLSRIDVRQMESINRTGLTKLACCSLSESFENSGTTGTTYSDAITGTRQIQMLGLSGIYVQTLAENIPVFRGLNYLFGWNYTPAAWLKSIQISKGAASVTSGYESVTGQINTVFASPAEGRQFYADVYTDEYLMTDANFVVKQRVGGKWRTALFGHATQSLMPESATQRHDRNGDGFADMPKVRNINLQNRWIYLGDNGLQSRFVVSAAAEKRDAGQMEMDGMQHELYKTRIENVDFQISNKTGFPFGQKEGQSVGLINSLSYHKTDAEFGCKSLNATELYYYGNLIFNSHIGNENHKYAAGVSYIFDGLTNRFADRLPKNLTPETDFDKKEHSAGAFAEYANYSIDNLIISAGLRADYNSRYHWLLTPRLNVKYSPTDILTIRASAGRGYRSANPLSENLGLFSTSRKFHTDQLQMLDIEAAWNYGANLILTIPTQRDNIVLSIDFYRTDFQSRTICDIERDRHAVFFYNLGGKSHAYAAQADLSATLFKGLTFYSAFRYNIQHISYTHNAENHTVESPLVNRFKSLVNVSYATNMRKWIFDATVQLNGKCRLPNMDGYAETERYSDTYTILFAQITKRFKFVEIYVGAENLTDYRQKNPIIAPDAPFGDDFDASIVYAPVVGRKIYAGARFNFGKYMD